MDAAYVYHCLKKLIRKLRKDVEEKLSGFLTEEESNQFRSQMEELFDQTEGFKNEAALAKEDAEFARDIAVGAKDDALLAQSDAESARDTAVGARNEAVSAKEDAEDARDIAVQAKDDA